jgi:hypothetical protein
MITKTAGPAVSAPSGQQADGASHGPVAARTASLGTGRVVAALLMVIGIGWNAGLEAQPFHPAIVGISALAVHILPLAALMFLLVPALRSGLAGAHPGRGISIAAAVALAFGIFTTIFSATHPHASMGIHHINDALPIVILEAGALLWLVAGRRVARAAR